MNINLPIHRTPKITMPDASFDLHARDRTVLITGGAGGLGAPTAEIFAAAGARVLILDRNDAAGLELARRINATQGREAHFIHADLAAIENVSAQVRELAVRHRVDILINNAAVYPSKEALAYSLSEYEQVQRINATAAFACSQAVLPGMIERRWGRIINISSITFGRGWSRLAPYVISKGALIGLTRALAREFGEHGVTVNAVCPGAFPTEAERIQGDAAEYEQYVLGNQCVKRRGTPADFAYALLFLASDYAGFITGQSLNVDGGWVLQ